MNIWSGNSNQNTTGTLIAIIDDGIRYSHPEFSGQLRNGISCLSSVGAPLNNCLFGYDAFDGDTDPLPYYSDTHGTHIAGIIGAKTNNEI